MDNTRSFEQPSGAPERPERTAGAGSVAGAGAADAVGSGSSLDQAGRPRSSRFRTLAGETADRAGTVNPMTDAQRTRQDGVTAQPVPDEALRMPMQAVGDHGAAPTGPAGTAPATAPNPQDPPPDRRQPQERENGSSERLAVPPPTRSVAATSVDHGVVGAGVDLDAIAKEAAERTRRGQLTVSTEINYRWARANYWSYRSSVVLDPRDSEGVIIACFVIHLWDGAYEANTIAYHLTALGREGMDVALGRRVLQGLRRAYPEDIKQAPILSEADLTAMINVAPDPLRLVEPARVILAAALRAPLAQLRIVDLTAARRTPEWMEIDLPPAVCGISRVLHAGRTVRLATRPGHLLDPGWALGALLDAGTPFLPSNDSWSSHNRLPRRGPIDEVYASAASEADIYALVLRRSLWRLIPARARVVLTLGYEALLRGGEFPELRIGDFRWLRRAELPPGYDEGLRMRIPRSKSNQRGDDEFVTVLPRDDALCAVAAIRDWLALVPWAEGPLVPRLHHPSWFLRLDPPPALSGEEVGRIVQQLSIRAGLPKATSHSLRRSGATELFAACGDLDVVRRALRHTSTETTSRYIDLRARVRRLEDGESES